MDLYIANGTSQKWNFHYRVLERKSFMTQEIPIGEQIVIPNLSPPDVDYLIQQGAKYGMVDVAEMDRVGKAFKGLCYSIGKPVKSDKIERLFRHNTNVLVEQGREFRKNAAIVENNRLLRTNQEMDLPNIRRTEMTIQEETGEMAEGYKAEFDTATPRAPKGGRRRAA